MENSPDDFLEENLDLFDFDITDELNNGLNIAPEVPQSIYCINQDTTVDMESVSSGSSAKKRVYDNTSSSEVTTDDDSDFAALKAMRMGSVDRILTDARIANESIQSGSVSKANEMTSEERAELLKSIVLDYNKCFAFSDTNALAKFIRQHCAERILYVSPHNRDPAIGKADFMILMSLVIETYPDAIGHVTDFTVEDDKVRYTVDFQGTKMFPYSIETVFKQIKAHIKKEQVDTGVKMNVADNALIESMTERINPAVSTHFLPPAPVPTGKEQLSRPQGPPPAASAPIKSEDGLSQPAAASVTSAPRASAVASAVLQQGVVKFRWQTTFFFTPNNLIASIISFDAA
eukprot:gene29405-35494_t